MTAMLARTIVRWCGTLTQVSAMLIASGCVLGTSAINAQAIEAGSPSPLLAIDSVSYCDKVTALLGDNPIFKQGCMDNEANAKRDLDRVWSAAPAKIEQECLKFMAAGAPPSYQGLSGCLAMAVGNYWMRGDLVIVPKS